MELFSIRIQRTFQLVSTPKAGEADFASVVEGLRKEAGRRAESVLILMNGSDKEVNLPLARYAEVLRGKTSGKEILTGKEIPLGDELSLAPKGIFVLEM